MERANIRDLFFLTNDEQPELEMPNMFQCWNIFKHHPNLSFTTIRDFNTYKYCAVLSSCYDGIDRQTLFSFSNFSFDTEQQAGEAMKSVVSEIKRKITIECN